MRVFLYQQSDEKTRRKGVSSPWGAYFFQLYLASPAAARRLTERPRTSEKQIKNGLPGLDKNAVSYCF